MLVILQPCWPSVLSGPAPAEPLRKVPDRGERAVADFSVGYFRRNPSTRRTTPACHPGLPCDLPYGLAFRALKVDHFLQNAGFPHDYDASEECASQWKTAYLLSDIE